MTDRLDTALDILTAKRDSLAEAARDALAGVIEAFVGGGDLESKTILSPIKLAELDRRLNQPITSADSPQVTLLREKHGAS